MTPEDELRDALVTLHQVARDGDRRPILQLREPGHAGELDQLEGLLVAALPRPARLVLETLDGSFGTPISPCRPDYLLAAFEISSRIRAEGPREVIPIIDRGVDSTGLSLLLGISFADPWGPLVAGDGFEFLERTPHTLLDWFAQVIAEARTYRWPAPLALAVEPTLDPLATISLAALGQLPVGVGVVVRSPEPVKRNRMKLRLFLQLEPGVWALGYSRQGDDQLTLHERCIDACAVIARETRRHRSQWALSATDVASSILPGREMYTVGVAIGER